MALITTQETAKRLYTTPYTVRKYIRRGLLEAVKLGKHYLITEKAVEEFLERLRHPQASSKKVMG